MMGIDTRKLHFFAKIVSPFRAQKTSPTRHSWLHCNAISSSQILYAFADFNDNASGFVSQYAIAVNYQTSNCAGFPEMYV
jgi:hypothetical protein